MPPILVVLSVALAGYLVGSIPFPVLVSRLVAGVDLRDHGSGNMGARNAGRVLGKPWFLVVFLLDAAKGAAATYFGLWSFTGTPGDPVLGAAVGAVAATLGHCFPVWAGFRGGLGLAVTAGALLVISPLLLLLVLVSAGGFWLVSRDLYVGVAVTALLYPAAGYYFGHPPAVVGAMALWGGLVFLVHWSRVARWLAARRRS